jgi:hypothetical protein
MGMRSTPLFATVISAIVVALIGPTIIGSTSPLLTEPSALASHVPTDADDVAMFDPSQGIWHLGTRDGNPASFYFGVPGDFPIMGDWDCDDIDTPGLYRQADGYVYLRNTNSQGVADIKFFFGNPGDIPLAGDFNGDGCDTVSIYRPTEARIYVINSLGSNDGGLGSADYSYLFGNTGDKPFVGDFDANDVDTVGLHRETTGFVYFSNTNATGIADHQFYFGDPGDRLVAGNWTGTGIDGPGVFRPSNSTMYLRYENTQGNADEAYRWGLPDYIPVAGKFGALDLPPLGCSILPPDNIWNRRVDTLPLDARSDQYVSTIGQSATLHADFGSGVWPPGSNSPIGIPFIEASPGQRLVDIIYTDYGSESDPGPFPIPSGAPIEGGPDADGDRHVIVLDRGACKLYELFYSFPQVGGAWAASSGASYDLTSNTLRPDGWTSADAAGLPIFPGLITYDEVASGVIRHAIRFTAPQTRNAYVWPARHDASNLTGTNYPPMGQRFRLKAGFDISGYSPGVRVMLQAFKDYGLILADNGSSWYISGAPDDRWNNDVLHEWDDIPGSAFEAVDVSALMVDPNSGATGP